MKSASGCGSPGRRLVRAVDDAVVEQREIGRVEDVAHREQAVAIEIAFEMNALGEREMNRDRLVGHADFDPHMMVLRQQPQLLAIVVAEQVGRVSRVVSNMPGPATKPYERRESICVFTSVHTRTNG